MYKPYTALLLLLCCLPAAAADEDNDAQLRRLRFENREALRQQEEKTLEEGGETASAQTADNTAQNLPLGILGAVNRGDARETARLLAQYRALPGYGADLADFAEASISRLNGDYAQALAAYKALLERRPDFTRARLDYARTLFDNRQTKEAQAQFALLQREELPEAVNRNADAYRRAAQMRGKWHGSLAVGAVYNSNIGETTGRLYCFDPYGFTCAKTPPPERAHGYTYEASAEKHRPLSGHHGLFARAALYGTRYQDFPDNSEDTLAVSAGYRFSSAQNTWSLAPAAEWSRADSRLLYRSAGLRGEWQHDFSDTTAFNWEAEHREMRYADDYRSNNGCLSAFHASLLHAPSHNWLFYGSANVQKRKTQQRASSYLLHGFQAGAQYRFGDTALLRLQASLRFRRYDGFNAWIQVRRSDREQAYSATLKIPRLKAAGFSPVFHFKHTRVHDNAGWLAGYRKNEAGIRFERFF